jgi:hypothetical protein
LGILNRPGINVREIVVTAMRCHPKNCVFKAGAVERIVKRGEDSLLTNREKLIDAIEQGFLEEEIYCPHEGIDKRAEYYAQASVEGWNEWSRQVAEFMQ